MGIMCKDTDCPSYKSINFQLMLGNKTTQYIDYVADRTCEDWGFD